MARKRVNEFLFEVKKPPSDITFVPPDSILHPYPIRIKIDDPYLDNVKRKFEEYICNGIAWANDQRKKGNPYARFPSEAVCVNNLRLEIKEWREKGYPDVTETTRYLLNFWFEQPRDKVFWFSQREAVEALIYLYEVKGITKVSELLKEFGAFKLSGYGEYDKYPRYAFRMATGSGKTLVMALLTVWSFFNYLYEDKEKYTRFFLFVAPNIIVYDRLRKDLEDLSIYEEFQLIPKDWKRDFKVQVITRDAFSNADRFPPPDDESVIFVTNIHQIGFIEKKTKREDIITTLFDIPSPGKEPYKAKSIRLWEILNNYPNLMILKDEAHHIHREEARWQNYLWDLHEALMTTHSKGIFMELDFTATPKDERGALFPWIIVDFSLREALQTGIVKYPAKVIVHDAPPIKKGFSIEDFMPYIRAALERWRKHKEKLRELGRKSVLFIMADEISSAEAIYEKLLEEPDINSSNMMLIHSELDEWKTKLKQKGREIVSRIRINGEEKEIDKEQAVKLVRWLDDPENPIEVISSVMMLNEGWDVRSVTVILGLRSYASEREILPEQVIGRGLRKLFPQDGIDTEKWVNILEIVGPPNLLKVLDNLEQLEGIKIPNAPEEFFVSFNPRADAPEEFRFEIPKAEFLSFEENIDTKAIVDEIFSKLPSNVFELSEIDEFKKKYEYEVIDLKGQTLDEGQIETPLYDIPIIGLTRLARELQEEIPLPNSFNLLVNILEKYITEKLFNQPVELNDDVLRFLSTKGWYLEIKKNIINIARPLIENPIFSIDAELKQTIKVEELESFPWTKDFVDSEKSLFVRIIYEDNEEKRIPSSPVDNDMERDFVNFLTRARDVISFIKNIPHKVGLGIVYYDSRERKWRKFYPDFIVKSKNGLYIVETKGREEIQISDKNIAAKKWCEAVSKSTGETWIYLYLREGDWDGKDNLKDCKEDDTSSIA
ncbi:MAG: DEAD/DEAH box helicase family protein [Thermoplasmatales archaeon]|nr:DEAD/DEAH box helicase family protein [Thermoplasmatales archaeon]